jgi:hypothetical protein
MTMISPLRGVGFALAPLFVLSCSTLHRLPDRPLDDSLKAGVTAADPKSDDAVVLRHEVRYLLVNPPRAASFMEIQRYTAIKVLTEAGFEAASQHVVVPENGQLVALHARTITADGTRIDVAPTSIIDDTAVVKGKKQTTKSFQFPRVAVGAILELSSTIHYNDQAWWAVSDEPTQEYPVVRYDAELVLDRYAVPDLLLMNGADVPLDYTKDGEGLQHVKFSLANLKASSKEPYRPRDAELEPWWMYRTISWKYPNRVAKGLSDWNRAVGHLHPRLVEKEDMSGPTPADKPCDTARCRIEAALNQVRTEVPLTAFHDYLDARPLETVKASSEANNHEKALYLYSLLKQGNIDAHLAVMRRNRAPYTATFPSPDWFDHMVVYVPQAAHGGAGDLWIDPSCEFCGLGQLPSWSHGSDAMVVSVADGEWGKELRAAAAMPAAGEQTGIGETTRRLGVQVATNGDVTLSIEQEVKNAEAVDTHIAIRDWDKKQQESAARDVIKRRSDAAELTSFEPWSCDRAAGRCVRRMAGQLPAYATQVEKAAVAGTLLLPLTLLTQSFDAHFKDKKRDHDIFVNVDESESEELRVTPPPGYRFDPGESLKASKRAGAADGLVVDAEVAFDGDVLVVRRHHKLKAGRYPKATWAAWASAMASSTALTSATVPLVPVAPAAPATP